MSVRILGFELVNRFAVFAGHKETLAQLSIMNSTLRNIERSVSQVECFLVKVPFRSNPRKLFDFFNRHNCLP